MALKTCTHCGANISVVAVYCQACSEWLYPTSRPLQYLAGSNPYLKATPAVTGVTLKVCPHCGAHVSVVGVACRACSVCLYPTSQPIKYLAGSNPYI
ncbi:MAG TPA: zinc ribbon domain-containing protein, partial [Verrucomicrobiae bacterium]